jgi:hypothetical protein
MIPEILGVTLAICLLTLGHLSLHFVLIVKDTELFRSFSEKVVSGDVGFLPITVVSAIFLFLIKEGIENYKKKKERKRKIAAIKSLFSEEIKLNYWVFAQLKSLLKTVDEAKSNAIHEIICSNSGEERFETRKGNESLGGQGFPKIKDVIYHKYVLTIAEQEPELYIKALDYHKSLARLGHIRNGVYDYIDMYGTELDFGGGFIPYAFRELPDIHDKMSVFYLACTGDKLVWGRIR